MSDISCTCQICKDMCNRPCWPTPDEVQKLIASGYGDRLMLDYWVGGGKNGDNIQLIAPAEKGSEGRSARFWPSAGCTFQDKNGLCQLHNLGLKPYEGRKALCGGRGEENLHEKVAQMWNNRKGRATVAKWRTRK